MRNGFTLIELLAVIVILSVIALIATPIVLGIIEDSKMSTIKHSGQIYMNTVEQAFIHKNFDEDYNPTVGFINRSGNLFSSDRVVGSMSLTVKIDGQKPVEGYLVYDEGKIVTALNLKYGNYYLTVSNGKQKLTLNPLGDVDGNGIGTSDATALQNYILSGSYKEECDVNLDGVLNTDDNDLLLEYQSYKQEIDLLNEI